MNKVVYLGINILAIIICIFLIIMAKFIVKVFGLVGLFFIIKELVTGGYGKYTT